MSPGTGGVTAPEAALASIQEHSASDWDHGVGRTELDPGRFNMALKT